MKIEIFIHDSNQAKLNCLEQLIHKIFSELKQMEVRIMGELQDEYQAVKKAIADERIEVLTAIQKIIDNAGGSDDKITLAQLKELKADVQGVYTETPTVPVPPVEPPTV